jgi:NADH oxidase (H2O2-forming)
MPKKTNVLIIGGGPSAVVAAITAKKRHKDKKVTVIRNLKKAPIPCGIPYVFGSLESSDQNLIPDKVLLDNNIELIIDEVMAIDKENKTIKTKTGDNFSYEKLIIATGSLPIQVPIEGVNLLGVYEIRKDVEYLKKLKEALVKTEKVVIIGGGFIGIEMADEIKKMGKKVTIVETLPHCLEMAFDEEFCVQMEEKLTQKGIQIFTNTKVMKIMGTHNKVEKVLLSNKKEIKTDAVILAIGAVPNTKLAQDAGLEINKKGAVVVNEYMKTSDADISAIGDCAQKTDFFTKERITTMLASTATSEARIAGLNVYDLQIIRQNKGTIGIFSTSINELSLAAAGLIEKAARKNQFDIVIGQAIATDKHPGALPNMSKTKVKLIFSKHSGTILGGQISGGVSVGEMINIVGLSIQNQLTISDLVTMQIGTHPLLTASPIAYPIIGAAQNALSKIHIE